MKKQRIVSCPACKKSLVYDLKNPFRPFCSERCQILDRADWADESHRIAGEPVYQLPDDSDSENP